MVKARSKSKAKICRLSVPFSSKERPESTSSPEQQELIEQMPRRSIFDRITSRWPFRRAGNAIRRLAQRHDRTTSELLSQNPAARVVSQNNRRWIAFLTPGWSKRDARRANLSLTVKILEESGIPYIAIPNDTYTAATIAINEDRWEQFIAAMQRMATASAPYVGVAVKNRQDRIVRWSAQVEHPIIQNALRSQHYIELFKLYEFNRMGNFHGRPQACRVERWNKGSDGTLKYSGRSARTDIVGTDWQRPIKTQVIGVTVASVEQLVKRHIFQLTGRIDVVYMWVDGADAEWRRNRDTAIRQITGEIPTDSIDASRFRDNGELRYSLRSLLPHLEWVGKIILVTDDQKPDWLDPDHPRIRLVSHRELFDDSATLPTFNSHAIASRLHHISGLSEQYLVFNDDIFLGLDAGPATFFQSNGVSKFFLSKATLPYPDVDEVSHEAARRNVVKLLEKDFGRTVTRTFYHTPVPQLKSTMMNLEERYPEIFHANWNSQLRSEDDYEVNAWLHHYFGYLTGRSTPGRIVYDYFDLSDERFVDRLNQLEGRANITTFCINDSPGATERNIRFLEDWLANYYIAAAPWELDRERLSSVLRDS